MAVAHPVDGHTLQTWWRVSVPELSLSVLQNQIVAAELLWGNFAVELCARLHAAPSIQARVLLFEELLRTRLHDAPYGLDID
ncbi:MAG: hypothetical protein R2867_11035 [Caldilineaceae bacterium]